MSTFNLSKRIKIAVSSPDLDSMYGPYESVSAANTAVVSQTRAKGKTVGVLINGGVVEYWWKSGITDSDLVLKTAESGGDSPFSLNSNNTGIQSGNNIASGSHSLAVGTNSKASDYGSLVGGQYNSLGSTATSATSFNTANTAFVIGNGTSSNAKSDAFSVLFNGTTKTKNLTLGSTTEMSGTGSFESVFTLENLSTSGALNTAQFFDISRAPNSDTPNASSYAALYRLQSSENSNFESGDLIGFNAIARHKANGSAGEIIAAKNQAEIINTHNVTSGLVIGSFNHADISSTSASGNITLSDSVLGSYNDVTIGNLDANEEPVQSQQTVSHSVDSGSIHAGLNVFRAYNPNFTSRSITAGSNHLDIKAGNLDKLEVSNFNVVSFPNKIDASLSIGQFSYLKIEEDGVIPRVTGSSYAINSRSPLLSKFNGALDITGGIAEKLSGTVITNGTTSVFGTNTQFLSQLSVGDKIRINNTIRTVDTISNNSTLILDQSLLAVLNSNDVNENQYIYRAEKIIKLKSNDEVEKFSVDAQGAVNIVSSATASSFIKQGGTSSQYLMADGSISTSSGGGAFEEVTESGKTGIRQTGANASFYGDIGTGAVDLSYSHNNSITRGATGDYSVAMGYNPTASGNYSTATGQATTASGNYSTAMGEGAVASGITSIATGRYTEAIGNYSTAMGRDTVASGGVSTAMGYDTEAVGYASTTLGYLTQTSVRGMFSLVNGSNSTAAAENCLSSGFHTVVSGFSGTAIGNYNEDTSTSYNDFSTSNNAFMIGNGTPEQRANCFEVKFSGATVISSTVTATNFILSSDKKLKNNIEKIKTNHIDVNWKNFELKSEPGVKRAGVIAQELEEVHPEFVRTDSKGTKSVAYIDLLITKIAELEARLEKLEK
jgi:hypothetical protein